MNGDSELQAGGTVPVQSQNADSVHTDLVTSPIHSTDEPTEANDHTEDNENVSLFQSTYTDPSAINIDTALVDEPEIPPDTYEDGIPEPTDDDGDDTPLVDISFLNTSTGPAVDKGSTSRSEKLLAFPLGRIKSIMKADPETNVVSAECVVIMAKATELFLQYLGKEMYSNTIKQKKKTLQKKDLDTVIVENTALQFLDGALD